MATTYRKTPKGISEIETRAHRLSPRLRSALIMVDGKRSDDDLRPLLQQHTDEALLALVAEGFIEVVSVSDAARAAAPAGAPGTAAPYGPAFEALRRDVVRHVNDQVGPMAESLAIRLERARSADEIRPLLETAWKLVGNVRGTEAAAAFRARFITW
jgi:hypothetical protein